MARIFLLKFRADGDDAIRRLRNTLKTALRRDRLVCVDAREITETDNPRRDDRQNSAKESSHG
jgi:hypothetical protein